VGSKKNPVWRVVVADQRAPRDGRSIETLGHYNPQTEPSTIVVDRERLDYWLERGAQPSGSVKKLMRAPNTEMVSATPPAAVVEEATAEAATESAPSDVAGAVEPEATAAPDEAPAQEADAPEAAEPEVAAAEAEQAPADAGDADSA
jgi:small subunit ribosomal protein S16